MKTPLTRNPPSARSVLLALALVLSLLAAPAHAQETYTVRPGDTLYRIATTHDMTVDALLELNGLTSNAINVGQELIVSGDGEAAPGGALGGVSEHVREAVGLSNTAVVRDTTIAAGPVVVFPASYEGRLMAGGEPYEPSAFAASHPTLPMGAVVLLEHRASGRVTLARIGDRGPIREDVVMEISQAVADELGLGGAEDATMEDATIYVWPVE